MNAARLYQCNECRAWYRDALDAGTCCDGVAVGWECVHCAVVHDAKAAAERCCTKEKGEQS